MASAAVDALAVPTEPKDLWVPSTFAKSGKIYLLSGTHRGDMYHVRGAMILEPHPLLVFDCSNKTLELTAYLAKPVPSPADVFLSSWTWEQLSGANNPGGTGYSKQEFEIISESAATTIIRNGIKGPADKEKLSKGVAIIHKDDEAKLRTELEAVCANLFEKPKDSETTILIQYRDTGTKGLGIYPELDSGTISVLEIATWIRAIPKKGNDSLNVVLCGNASPIGNIHSIGEYFKSIDSDKYPRQTKRDIEAFFLKVAFDKHYFRMAVGFRSGGLDVFTFLGIPSISISARQMVGEGRHGQLAQNNLFNRWNIQYELPRHITTKYLSKPKNQMLGSPWWLFPRDREPTAAEKAHHSDTPTGFHKYDSEIVRIGIYNATIALLPWKTDPFIKPPVQNHEFSNTICRPCYFSNVGPPANIHRFVASQRDLEKQDFATRLAQLKDRNEDAAEYHAWETKMENQWTELLKKYPGP
ncbi:MAG: hypothetical protein M1840_005223 [Geoglossum simile]|nr:MAG: hypothetical protein M1840_005223 [Geoglossum simile]